MEAIDQTKLAIAAFREKQRTYRLAKAAAEHRTNEGHVVRICGREEGGGNGESVTRSKMDEQRSLPVMWDKGFLRTNYL